MVLLQNLAVDWIILWGIKWIICPTHNFQTFSTGLAKQEIKENPSEEPLLAVIEEIFKQNKNKNIYGLK